MKDRIAASSLVTWGDVLKLLGIAIVCVPSVVSADAPASVDPETIVIIDRAPDRDADPAVRDRDRALGEAPFVTIVHPDDHPATASVADAIGATACHSRASRR